MFEFERTLSSFVLHMCLTASEGDWILISPKWMVQIVPRDMHHYLKNKMLQINYPHHWSEPLIFWWCWGVKPSFIELEILQSELDWNGSNPHLRILCTSQNSIFMSFHSLHRLRDLEVLYYTPLRYWIEDLSVRSPCVRSQSSFLYLTRLYL